MQADPGNAGWQRDLSTSYIKIGDVQVAEGNLPAALSSYRASHRGSGSAWRTPIRAIELGARPVEYCTKGSATCSKAKGNVPAALTSYRTSIAIAERLAPE